MARTRHGLPGIYNSTPITLGNEEGAALALDSAGRVIFTLGGAAGYAIDESAMPATPSILPVGGEYRASPTTYTDGDAFVLQGDVSGNLFVSLGTKIAGENLTDDLLRVEPKYTASALLAADGLVKTGAGVLHTVTFLCNDAAPTAGSIIGYNNTAESGTQLFNHTFTTTPFVPFSLLLDVDFSTGLYIGFTTTADVNVLASYR